MKKGRKSGIIEASMRYHKIMFFMIGMLVVLGIYALQVMPKQEFPEFTIREGLIIGIYPGATSAQAEEQLAKPLEQFLFTYNEINKNKTYTMSRDGIVIARVELNDYIKNKDEVWSKIKHGLISFKQELPAGVLALVAKDDFGDTSALLISLESETKSYRELEKLLEILEGRLRRIESVSNLRRYGIQSEQVTVFLDREQLASYGIDHKILMGRLFSQGFTTTAGSVETPSQELPVYIAPVYDSEREVGDQIIHMTPGGGAIRLKDVARIVREYDEPDSYILNNGKRAILLSTEMHSGYNIIQYGRDVEKVLKTFIKELPEDISVERIADQPKVVEDSVRSFIRDLFTSILIVILSMIILFPLRSAIVAATTIPISIMISIGIMYMFGIPMNTVTLAALIVVLGMIVDNSIVVVDSYLEYLDKGMSRWSAAVASAKNYANSILLATLCICIIFYPLLLTLTGLYFDFIIHFPWTLTAALMISFGLAMVYIPFMEFMIIKKGLKAGRENKKKKKFDLLDIIQKGYDRVLGWTFRFPKLTMLIGLGLVTVSALVLMKTDTRMLPFSDRDQFAVEIFLPQGSTLAATEEVADSMYNILVRDERVKSITSFIGTSSPRFHAAYAPNIAGKNFAQFIVNTQSIKATNGMLNDYMDKYADYFPNAYVKIKQLDNQTFTIPIEVRVSGENIQELKSIADTLIYHIQDINGLVWIHHNYEELLPSVEIDLNTVEAFRLGISRTGVQIEIAANYDKIQAGTIWEEDYPVPVIFRVDNSEEDLALDKIGDRYISTSVPGVSVPLRQVADIKPVWHEGQIVRRNGVRTISVFANVNRGCNEVKATKKIMKVMDSKIVPFLPEGITYEYGGMVESDAEIISPIIIGVSAAIFLIFLFLLLNFKKLSVAAASLLSIILCLPGAVFGIWITGTIFGLTCILGLISLMGIIVRNAIIMFEHAEDLRNNHNIPAKDAAYEAGSRRMVPIFLTSATTAVGVIPMIISDSLLWTPMGIVIFFGTIGAMILVVTMLPITYWKIFDKSKNKEQNYE